MALRPGIDFSVGVGDYAALVNLTDKNVTLHQDDPRVPGSSAFTLSPNRIEEPKGGGSALIRFQFKDWCVAAQRFRPHHVKVVTAEQGIEIRDKAKGYAKTGLSNIEAVKKAYYDVTKRTPSDVVSQASILAERDKLLARLKQERDINLDDQDKYGHVTNRQLLDLLDNPLLLDEIEAAKAELSAVTEESSTEERERKRLYDLLSNVGKRPAGRPSLAKLRGLWAEHEQEEAAEALAQLEAKAAEAARLAPAEE